MVNNISWGSYWSVLIILTVIYYAYVLWVYYRSDIFQRLAVQKAIAPASPLTTFSQDQSKDELFPVVQSFTSEMSAYLEQASYARAAKNEIIFGLQQIAKKHPGIKDSQYQPAINSLIIFESKDKCAVSLSEEEVGQVW